MIDLICFRLFLSKTERIKLMNEEIKARQRGDATAVKRILAILAVGDGETDLKRIARFFRVSTEAVRQWLKRYLMKGVLGLSERRYSPGRPSKLTAKQRRELEQLIYDGPEAAGFPGACWRSPMIQDLIQRRFGIFYNVKYLSQLLDNMGFSYQKARFAVGGKDPDNERKREEWRRTKWPGILAEARTRGALLLFGDEASFPQWGTLTYTWAKKGQQPTVRTSGLRKACKVFGLIDYFSGCFYYKMHEERLNSESYQIFLQAVLARTTRPVILIQDGARYHTSRAMRQFFAEQAERLTVYELPPYSPDYNPIEKLWKKIKERETHLHYFPTWESLTTKVETALLRFTNLQSEILSLFTCYEVDKAA